MKLLQYWPSLAQQLPTLRCICLVLSLGGLNLKRRCAQTVPSEVGAVLRGALGWRFCAQDYRALL